MRYTRRIHICHAWRGLLCLLAVASVFLCLASCSDEVLYPDGGGDLVIETLSPSDSAYIGTSGSLVIETPPASNDPAGDPSDIGGTTQPVETGGLVIETQPVITEPGEVILPSPGDPFATSPHVMRAEYLNVGDADAILLRMDGTVILIDAGESNAYPVISAKLRGYGISTIDYFIITHYDNDHIGSARSVLSDFTVKNVYMPAYVRNSSLYRSMMSMLNVLSENGTTKVNRLVEDVHLDMGYGSMWINPTRLYPPDQTLGSDNSHTLEENNYSLIISVTFGQASYLFAGDAEGDRMAEFLALLGEDTPAYHVLKIPHHGGFDKELGDFLRAFKDDLRYCVISVGSDALVERDLEISINATSGAAYFTYNGHIEISTDGTVLTVNQIK